MGRLSIGLLEVFWSNMLVVQVFIAYFAIEFVVLLVYLGFLTLLWQCMVSLFTLDGRRERIASPW
jgi:hypothetical protein